MTNKNFLMNQKFNDLSIDDKMKVLNINDEYFNNVRFKYLSKEMVINDSWNGKTNSQKRNMIKAFLTQ